MKEINNLNEKQELTSNTINEWSSLEPSDKEMGVVKFVLEKV